jgi:hypothetical protein
LRLVIRTSAVGPAVDHATFGNVEQSSLLAEDGEARRGRRSSTRRRAGYEQRDAPGGGPRSDRASPSRWRAPAEACARCTIEAGDGLDCIWRSGRSTRGFADTGWSKAK